MAEDQRLEEQIKDCCAVVRLATDPTQSSDPTPLAYINVYEQGDIWIKIQGCDACPVETRRHCCGNCPYFYKDGCGWHTEKNSSKPFNCVVKPYPNRAMNFCALEFRCIKGSRAGKTRRVCDPGDVFVDA